MVVRSELCICIPAVRCEPSFSDLRFGSSRELLAVRSELPAVRLGSSRELPAVRSELPENPGTAENPGPNVFGMAGCRITPVLGFWNGQIHFLDRF